MDLNDAGGNLWRCLEIARTNVVFLNNAANNFNRQRDRIKGEGRKREERGEKQLVRTKYGIAKRETRFECFERERYDLETMLVRTRWIFTMEWENHPFSLERNREKRVERLGARVLGLFILVSLVCKIG